MSTKPYPWSRTAKHDSLYYHHGFHIIWVNTIWEGYGGLLLRSQEFAKRTIVLQLKWCFYAQFLKVRGIIFMFTYQPRIFHKLSQLCCSVDQIIDHNVLIYIMQMKCKSIFCFMFLQSFRCLLVIWVSREHFREFHLCLWSNISYPIGAFVIVQPVCLWGGGGGGGGGITGKYDCILAVLQEHILLSCCI